MKKDLVEIIPSLLGAPRTMEKSHIKTPHGHLSTQQEFLQKLKIRGIFIKCLFKLSTLIGGKYLILRALTHFEMY